MAQPKKLIEVAMPIKEISAESVRDKSIRHGHISTLHLWWARRPLPVCRAVVFASLVPDPLDEHCPQAFRDAVDILLGRNDQNAGDPYRPYDDIPYTAVQDKMEDNLRNRLLMFIGKFSDKFIENERLGKTTSAKDQLANESLIKWDNKNNEAIIGKARKLIFVGYQCTNKASQASATDLLANFDTLYGNIKKAEKALYTLTDRHLETEESKQKTTDLNTAIETFLDEMPRVFDPFAGGGAIPLEAARLGCRTYGNDINPVAHIIQKGSLEFPQKFGKPVTYTKDAFIALYGTVTLLSWCKENGKHPDMLDLKIDLPNRLSFDVEFYAKKMLDAVENEIGCYYPANEKGDKPIAYYWSRVIKCSNPSCQAEIPMLKDFYLSKRRGISANNYVYLNPIIEDSRIEFSIEYGIHKIPSWNNRGNISCPCCGSITPSGNVKTQLKNKKKEILLALIFESTSGKVYKRPQIEDLNILHKLPIVSNRPTEALPTTYSKGMAFCLWGYSQWGEMFNDRQILFNNTFISCFKEIEKDLSREEYGRIILHYLAILLDRIIARNNSFVRWHTQQDTIEHPFSRQAIQMVFDYPEMHPFGNFSGSVFGQLNSILAVINEQGFDTFNSICNNISSGEKEFFKHKSVTAVVTDPPYFDAIAYADLSDFFYVWLKRLLGEIYPYNFSTPQTPKAEECTALKHHHNEDAKMAKEHFENKLTEILVSLEHQSSDIVSIMFAHQSTEAWTTLCNSILKAQLNITGSWAIDTEMSSRAVSISGASLTSSVTVSCKPLQKAGYGEYREVKKAIEATVAKEVEELYKLGFRGADLLTACFGQAVSEFGKYKQVEKADGNEVTVAELLELAREAAFNALLKGFDGDEFTKFYIAWLQLYGFVESDFDDAAKFTRAGLSINVSDLFNKHIFIKNVNKQRLGGYAQRMEDNKNLGEKADSILIDQVHRAMSLFAKDRLILLRFISDVAPTSESSFWRVVAALKEVLPPETDDYDDAKRVNELITNKENLIRESKHIQKPLIQGTLGF